MIHFSLRSPHFRIVFVIIFISFWSSQSFAGTMGKISGKVIDRNTKEGIIGVNILLEGTYLGAVSDPDGYYSINNVTPGKYTLVVSMVGYDKTKITNVIVKIDLTTSIDIQLSETAVVAQEVVIQAERPLVQKDLTSSSVTISSDEMKAIPVENLTQLVNLQAGVVDGHFRGGRAGEVSYLVDGISVTNPLNGSLGVQVENSSIREMEVISGTFNAEYGQAMSGVVNIITQDGSSTMHGTVSGYIGDYITSHNSTFQGLTSTKGTRIKNLQATLSGPTEIDNQLTFFATGRYYHSDGYLYGKRVFKVTDDVSYFPDSTNSKVMIHRNTGDGSFVSMNPERRYSVNAKLTYSLPEIKFTYGFFTDDNFSKSYSHYWSWTPDGILNDYSRSNFHNVQITHVPSSTTIQSLKISRIETSAKGYLYENPYDSSYVSPLQGVPISGYTFQSGGNQGDRYDRKTTTMTAQWSLSSQITKEHKVGMGVEGRFHTLSNHNNSVINKTESITDSATGKTLFTLGYPNEGTYYNQQYTKHPYEASAYLQDKMEYDIMVINAGVRFDYFNPNTKLLADIQNPARNHKFDTLYGVAGRMVNAEEKIQVSPRLGVSFPITDQGIIHFSYGHFFQIPNFENLYLNSDYIIIPGQSLSSISGNPDLKAQRTVSYEVGLQQVVYTDVAVDFTLYYRDIRNLLGMELIRSHEGFRYARFINRDYGNTRGVILSVDKRFTNFFGAKIDYTYQFAEGNASDPYAVFYNNQTSPPIESNKKVVPLDWDQRNTLNISLTLGYPEDWSVGLIGSYGSGLPYTEDVRSSQGVRFENGGIKPSTMNVDLRAEKNFTLGGVATTAFVYIYNVFDIKSELGVSATTGRANKDLNSRYASQIVGLNTLNQYLNDPTSFSSPRQVQLGFSLSF